MASLLEAAASVGLSASLMATMTASLAGAVRVQSLTSAVAGELFAERQLEQLVDRATLLSGHGPTQPAAVSSISDDTVVFSSDLNGDGIVDTASSETTALEVRRASGRTTVRVRLGRQTMTVVDAGDDTGTISGFDAYGGAASAASATLVGLELAREAPDADEARRLLFSLPSRTMR